MENNAEKKRSEAEVKAFKEGMQAALQAVEETLKEVRKVIESPTVK